MLPVSPPPVATARDACLATAFSAAISWSFVPWAAYTRVNSHTGEVDLLLHARRRGKGNTGWELVDACTADPRDTEAVLAGAKGDPEAARSAIFQMVTAAHAAAAHERTGRKPQ